MYSWLLVTYCIINTKGEHLQLSRSFKMWLIVENWKLDSCFIVNWWMQSVFPSLRLLFQQIQYLWTEGQDSAIPCPSMPRTATKCCPAIPHFTSSTLQNFTLMENVGKCIFRCTLIYYLLKCKNLSVACNAKRRIARIYNL